MKLYFKYLMPFSFFFIFLNSCQKDSEPINQPPKCELLTSKLKEIKIKETITLSAYAYDKDGEIEIVEFFIDENLIGTSKTDPYKIEWYVEPEFIGEHTIKATATDDKGESSSEEFEVNILGIAPVAQFEINENSIFKGESVTFTDKSINTPTEWLWDFGDDSTSTDQNPIHTYKLAGSYTVTLKTSNSFGENELAKESLITVSFDYGTITDYDGNTYNTIKIGDQEWMAENLEVSHYPDGKAIPLVIGVNEWKALESNNTDDAYCFVKNDESMGYGALYTFAAALGDKGIASNENPSGVQGVCPNGWHLPSHEEWNELFQYIDNNHDGYLYDGSNAHISIYLVSKEDWSGFLGSYGINEYGFSALPSGVRNWYGNFAGQGYNAAFWTSRNIDDDTATSIYITNGYDFMEPANGDKSWGYSVRCIKN